MRWYGACAAWMLCLAVLVPGCLVVVAAGQQAAATPGAGAASGTAGRAAYLDDPKFKKEIAAAQDTHEQLVFRIEQWRKANKIAGGACDQCALNAAALAFRTGDLKLVEQLTTELEAKTTLAKTKATAEYLRGSSLLYANQGKPKPEQLVKAEAALRAAAEHDPKLHLAVYRDGCALALLQRDEEAKAAFARYVAETPATDRFHTRAGHFAANVALAREKMAPPFTVTTADGKQFTLDDMGGRVVLVDFWATWCGPCNEELPHIAKLAESFAGQPFVLISVSWDKDEGKWSEFVAKHRMTWNQYRDADHQLSTAYGVESIPHYFTIDSDGVLQDEKIGSGSNIDSKLRKLVAKAREAQAAGAGQGGEEVAGGGGD